MSVSVCMREREREREKGKEKGKDRGRGGESDRLTEKVAILNVLVSEKFGMVGGKMIN